MTAWFERHRETLAAVLEPGEQLKDAERVLAMRRRTVTQVPRIGFVLIVTDRRLVAVKASRLLARPQRVITSWGYTDGVTLAPAPFGRLRMVLPDRSVVTLRPYGPRSVSHLARA